MATIELERVHKTYPDGHVAAAELSLAVDDGELMVLVGPSGSGKSTILRLVAGLESVSAGEIRIGGRNVTHLPPQERDVAMVFQSYALYPHLSVRDNLGFGLRIRKQPRQLVERRVREVAESLDITRLLERKPAQLSGGERQRVALGRAIVREPQAFLLDEPLSNLDAQLRVETRLEIARLHRRLGATMLYVTHDQTEALTLGARIAVLRNGLLQQVADPLEIYRTPANRFVAGFIGSPGMNFLEGVLRDDADGTQRFEGGGLSLPLAQRRSVTGEGEPVTLGIRPQTLTLMPALSTDEPGTVRGVVNAVEQLGSEQVVYCTTTGGERLVAVVAADAAHTPDQLVSAFVPPDEVHFFSARDGVRLHD